MADGFDFGDGFKLSRDRVIDEREQRLRQAKLVMPFNISYLDDYSTGIHPSDLVVICAASGAGKTTIAALIAQLAARNGKRVHFFALEAHKNEIEQRMLFREIADVLHESKRSCPAYWDWFYGTWPVSPEIEDEALARFKKHVGSLSTFYRDEKFTADDITKRFAAVRSETDLIVLDHLHYVDSDDPNENRGLKEITKAIRESALAMDKPVIVVAHLRKKDRGKPRLIPEKDDVHGSSDIVKIATKVIALAPARDRPSSDQAVASTYMQVVKDRVRGETPFAALCSYDLEKMRYRDQYVVGRLNFMGDAFEGVPPKEAPRWARRGLCLGTPVEEKNP